MTCLTARRRRLFYFVLISLAIFVQSSFASVQDAILTELRRDDWFTYFTTPLAKAEIDGNFDALLSLVRNKGIDWKIRIRGIILIGRSGNPARSGILVNMLYNPFFNAECPSIKTNIVTALGYVDKDRYVIDALIDATGDRELLVREAAVKALGTSSNERAVVLLLKELGDRNFSIRLNAVRSLGQIRDPSTLPYLRKIAETDEDLFIRNEAIEAISRIKT